MHILHQTFYKLLFYNIHFLHDGSFFTIFLWTSILRIILRISETHFIYFRLQIRTETRLRWPRWQERVPALQEGSSAGVSVSELLVAGVQWLWCAVKWCSRQYRAKGFKLHYTWEKVFFFCASCLSSLCCMLGLCLFVLCFSVYCARVSLDVLSYDCFYIIITWFFKNFLISPRRL